MLVTWLMVFAVDVAQAQDKDKYQDKHLDQKTRDRKPAAVYAAPALRDAMRTTEAAPWRLSAPGEFQLETSSATPLWGDQVLYRSEDWKKY
ncbi:MAG: hypothetical protein AB7P04_06380 [Bacteriovoracia bacterium]